MTVRIDCFARIREIVGSSRLERELPAGASAADAFALLACEFPALEVLTASTRFARDGGLIAAAAALRDGDELALLPPYGGG